MQCVYIVQSTQTGETMRFFWKIFIKFGAFSLSFRFSHFHEFVCFFFAPLFMVRSNNLKVNVGVASSFCFSSSFASFSCVNIYATSAISSLIFIPMSMKSFRNYINYLNWNHSHDSKSPSKCDATHRNHRTHDGFVCVCVCVCLKIGIMLCRAFSITISMCGDSFKNKISFT